MISENWTCESIFFHISFPKVHSWRNWSCRGYYCRVRAASEAYLSQLNNFHFGRILRRYIILFVKLLHFYLNQLIPNFLNIFFWTLERLLWSKQDRKKAGSLAVTSERLSFSFWKEYSQFFILLKIVVFLYLWVSWFFKIVFSWYESDLFLIEFSTFSVTPKIM